MDTMIAKKGSKLAKLPIAGKPPEKAEMPLGTRMIICGAPKYGKSNMAATARDPLALDFEKGRLAFVDIPRLSPLYLNPGTEKGEYPFNTTLSDQPKGKKFNFLMDWMRGIYAAVLEDGGDTYKTLVVDTLDTLFSLLLQAYQGDFGAHKDQRQDFKAVYNKFLPLLQSFTDKLPVDQVYVCHTSEFTVDNKMRVALILPPLVKEWVEHHVEIIGCVYAPSSPGSDNRFYVGPRDGWPTADGTGKLPYDLPTTMPAIYAAWRGEDPEDYQPNFDRSLRTVADMQVEKAAK